MSEFNDLLEKSLRILFDYSLNFRLSIELIQKLSQQLKLDTFIDTDAYSHTIDQPLKDESGNIIKFQRLSIAGSLILIEFDFVSTTIHRVSFSLANQLEDKTFDEKTQDKSPTILKEGNINTIKINFSTDLKDSIINKCKSNSIELILLSCLQGDLLETFPKNLEYLANLDRLSTSQIDLFSYLDNVSLIFSTLNNIENSKSDNWLLAEGYKSLVGKVCINKPETKQVGLFLDFWKDYRYINHEYNVKHTTGNLMGRSYNALISIDSNSFKNNSLDYLAEVRDHVWEIDGEEYQFFFNDDTYLVPSRGANNSSTSSNRSIDKSFSSNWNLSLIFNYPIYLPVNLLEFIGIEHFNEVSSNEYGFFEQLNNEREILVNKKGGEYKTLIKNEVHSKFVLIDSLAIRKLADLPSFLKISRNHLVLMNILNKLVTKDCETVLNDSDIPGIDIKRKDKLKDSLQLGDDKVLSLQALNKDRVHELEEDKDLDEFLKESSPFDDHKVENLLIKINSISFNLPNFDISLSITGEYNSHNIKLDISISNGEIVKTTNDQANGDEMAEDEIIEKLERFTKSLDVTEDFIKALDHVFM